MLHTVRVRCCSLFHTVAAVVMFVYLYTLGWVFANLYNFQQTKGVCALGVGGRGGGGNHAYYMSQVLSFCQVTVVVMIVFMFTLGVYGNLYIFQLMKGEVLAAAALLPYASFLLGGLVAIVFVYQPRTSSPLCGDGYGGRKERE